MLLGAGGRVERGGVRGDHALRAAVARGAQRGGHGRLLALLQPRRGLVLGQVLEKIKQFLVDQWEMMTPRPRLAIGIIGGAQNFKLEGRKQQTFKSGLIGALKVNI